MSVRVLITYGGDPVVTCVSVTVVGVLLSISVTIVVGGVGSTAGGVGTIVPPVVPAMTLLIVT